MSSPYASATSWLQPKATFGQQPSQMGDLDFPSMSVNSDDIQSGTYPYHPSQLQLPSGDTSSPDSSSAGFVPSQSRSQSVSFGRGADTVSADSGGFTGLGATSNQSQDLQSFNPIFPDSSQDQMGWEHNSYRYEEPITDSFNPSGFHNGAESSYPSNNTGLSSSPNAMQDIYPQQPPHYYSSTPMNTEFRFKRPRGREQSRDDDQEADISDTKDTAKAKPKREHLLNQIREQAAQIKDLMAQLESSGNSPHRRSSSVTSEVVSSSTLQSPVLSPSTTDCSLGPNELFSQANPEANKAVEDWIAKAKQSFEEFDVFIGIGGAGMPKSYLVEGDPEKIGSDEDDDDYVNIPDNDSDYEFAVEHHDGGNIMIDGVLKHKGSHSSLGTNGTSSTPKTKHAGGSAKSAILPGEAVPFGLFGEMSLKAGPKRRGTSVELEQDKLPGIANSNFFRSSKLQSFSAISYGSRDFHVALPLEAMDKRLSSFQHPPLILSRGIITPKEAEQLFKITATDLNLHLPNTAKPLNENHARELLNRTRVWLNCFNLDRSTGSQYGKPPIINPADYMANHSENWWKSSPYNMKNFDIHLCAYNAELKVMADFIRKIYSDPDHPTGLNKNVDFERIATETDDVLKRLAAKWNAILEQGDMSDPQNSFRTGLIQLAYPYARLVALSYGFQHAFGKNHTDENPFLKRCLDAAFGVVNSVLHDIARPSQRIFLRHGPEAQSVFVTFASTFLVKACSLNPTASRKRLEIRETVQKVIDLLGSAEVSIDDRHGPGLYARFLKGLLAAPMAQVDSTSPPPRRTRISPNTTTFVEPVNTQSSRSTSSSLSPVPRQEALSFESFVGPPDPFAPSNSTSASDSLALQIGGEGGPNLPADFFQPSLPFDDAILHSMQSLSDPNVWHDITLPSNFNWNLFQGTLDMDYRAQDPVIYSDVQQQYMAGVQR
ncbi:hypothetical protein C0989_007482 [Termitomyces sp. Mn162]|nr:hypothetical protein C0989_007482 [Termitomyces sp. Mn162]